MSFTEDNIPVQPSGLRVSEKEELQRLNDRLASYVHHVRLNSDQGIHLDSSAFLKSAKILEEEINNLKNLYEQELDKLRENIEVVSREKTTLQIQNTKHQQAGTELQDRLAVETDKGRQFVEEILNLQRQVTSLESTLHSTKVANSMKMPDASDQLQRNAENLTREYEAVKHRYDIEQVARQEAEDRIQQLMKKLEFNDQVHHEQVHELRNRVETTTTTILSLEARVRDLSKNDTSVGDLLKSVREASEAEFKKYQIESDVVYNRNITVLKSQLDNDAVEIERLHTERAQLEGNLGDLRARVRGMEGQLANMDQQRLSMEEALTLERNRSTVNIQDLQRKLHEVQTILVSKMQEASTVRDSTVPLKAEIESLKLLLEEEERRMHVPHSALASNVPSNTSIRAAALGNILDNYPISTTTPPITHASVTHISPVASYTVPIPTTTLPFTQISPIYSHVPLSLAPTTLPSTFAPTQTSMTTMPSGPSMILNEGSLPSSQVFLPPDPTIGNYVSPMVIPSYPTKFPGDYVLPMAGRSPYEQDFTTTYIPSYLDEDQPLPDEDYPQGSCKYVYETNPSVNRLQMEAVPTPPESPKPTPPPTQTSLRAKSAPANGPRGRNVVLIPQSLGQGKDYFDEMFKDLQRDTLSASVRPKSSPAERPYSSGSHDYGVSTSSAIGSVKILEVNQDGKFVRLVNDGAKELEFGGYMLQQNVGGHPVAVYRFPPRTKFPGNTTITVWSGMNDPILHQPPTDFVWKEQSKWGTGPECTSILCRANGQAIAWSTAAHRFTPNSYDDKSANNILDCELEKGQCIDMFGEEDPLTELNMDMGNRQDTVYLRREKQTPPSLVAQRHPHGSNPSQATHPSTGQARPLMYGNDNSTLSRQSRQQSIRPDPIPGQPYSGASAQRMGTAPLRKYPTYSATLRGSGALANRSAGTIRVGPPTPFLSPLQQEFLAASSRPRSSSTKLRLTA